MTRLWELSVKNSIQLVRHDQKELTRLKKLVKSVAKLKAKVKKRVSKNGNHLDEVYENLKKIIESEGEIFNYIMKIRHDEEVLIHRLLNDLHDIDNTIIKLEKKGIKGGKFAALEGQLNREEKDIVKNLRKERKLSLKL